MVLLLLLLTGSLQLADYGQVLAVYCYDIAATTDLVMSFLTLNCFLCV